MKRLFVISALVLTAGAPAAQAATSPGDKAAIRRLQAQVRTLSAQVGSLGARVEALGGENQRLRQDLTRASAFQWCGYAITFDAIYLMMYNDDVLFSALGVGRVYGPQSGVNDQGACAAIGVNRTPWAPRYLASSAPGLNALLQPGRLPGLRYSGGGSRWSSSKTSA